MNGVESELIPHKHSIKIVARLFREFLMIMQRVYPMCLQEKCGLDDDSPCDIFDVFCEVIATPGNTSDHLCEALSRDMHARLINTVVLQPACGGWCQ